MQLKDSIPVWLRAPRNTLWLVAAAVLLTVVVFTSPQNVSVIFYKASLVSLAAVAGYWLDRALFPYARPDSYLARDWRYGSEEPDGDADYPVVPTHLLAFCCAMFRRAIVVGAAIVGVSLGL